MSRSNWMLAAKLICDALLNGCYNKVLKIAFTECTFPPHSSLRVTYIVHRELWLELSLENINIFAYFTIPDRFTISDSTDQYIPSFEHRPWYLVGSQQIFVELNMRNTIRYLHDLIL